MYRSFAVLVLLVTLAAPTPAQVVVGENAPPITLEAISNAPDGVASLSWADFGDQLVVLEFWGTWCAPCVKAIPHLNEMAEALEGKAPVSFLSVTFESEEKIAAFLEKVEMKSIIGYDTDQSMVKDFGVKAWPTTFLVRSGRVLARTSPTALTTELLAEVAKAEEPMPLLEELHRSDERFRARFQDEKPDRGSKPPVFYGDAHYQVSVSPAAADEQRSMSTAKLGDQLLMLDATATPARALIAILWQVHDWQIDAGDWAKEDMYSVILDVPPKLHEQARAIIAFGMGVTVERVNREISGLRATVAEGGLILGDEAQGVKSMSTYLDHVDSTITIKCEGQTIRDLFGFVSPMFGLPIDLPEDIASMGVSGSVELPYGDREAFIEAVREQLGIRLVPAEFEREICVVRRIEGEQG